MQKSGYAEERICRRAVSKSGRADMQKSEKYRLTKEEMNKT
jgi:hypothetical protein